MTRIYPEVLVLSNKHDYSTDHVSFQLNRIGASYLRLNRDQLSEMQICLDPISQKLSGKAKDFSFEILHEKLKSIYFRAPVYLRDNYQPGLSPNEQLSRSQWAAFIRSLSVFDKALWLNYPQATYQAEIKPYQLHIANKLGFDVPKTSIANSIGCQNIAHDKREKLIIKTLDPLVLSISDKEAFIYTNAIELDDLSKADISSAPIILQEALIPKIDIRVTVIENIVFAVEIKKDSDGIDKDWRLEKDNVSYTSIILPSELEFKCITLVKELGLKFGAIDLALHNGKYYFLEINPTGEWAWLVSNTNLEIDKAIADILVRGNE